MDNQVPAKNFNSRKDKVNNNKFMKYIYSPFADKHNVERHTTTQNNMLYLSIIVEEDNGRNAFQDYTYSPIGL